ncbi:hypothetical protein HYC85_020411 [Camellia sinensis]|uniref:Uncharacterized protein n=1 Tax=Camellia sinensis TaxID=4442 RepID=A0A7J7GPN9_CAMSI|nr:hypothetical protein HYC85_020411 [Camellia sinensis]
MPKLERVKVPTCTNNITQLHFLLKEVYKSKTPHSSLQIQNIKNLNCTHGAEVAWPGQIKIQLMY